MARGVDPFVISLFLSLMRIIFSLFIIMLVVGQATVVQAQDDDIIDPVLIFLKARLISIDDGSPVSYAHIVNMRTRGGTSTDANGYFSMEMLNVDSLGMSSLGYMREYFHVPLSYIEGSVLTLYARPMRVAISEVKVTGNARKLNLGLGTGVPDSIPPELRGDAFNKKPSILAAIFSPASFLQYHLSKREKQKREVRAAIISDEQWQRLSKYYNKDVVMSLTGLKDAEADTFMIYFNQKNVLTANANEYDVRTAILQQYIFYTQERMEEQKNEDSN